MNEQHTKAFPIMTIKVFMMHFMCPANSANIPVIAAGKPLKPLMDDDIMNEKISDAISHDAKTDRLHPPYIIKSAKEDQQNTWNREDDKKCIVLFKKTGLHLVMIFM